jgi:SAM-dependent methyltransferase
MKRRLAILAVVLVLAGATAWLARDWLVAQVYLQVLEWDGRVEGLQVDRVAEALHLTPGMRVADIGAGTGLFSWPLAREVGKDGLVYAVDVNLVLLGHIDRTAAAAGFANVRTVLAAEDDPLLPEPVDLVFMCDTLHKIEDRAAYLETLRRYLRPGGRIAIIDFEDWGLTPKVLRGWMTGAGYEFADSHDFVKDNFFVIYSCPSRRPVSLRPRGSGHINVGHRTSPRCRALRGSLG